LPRRSAAKAGLGHAPLKRFAAGVAGVEVVPELDVFFVLFPAEKDFLAADEGREVEQAALKIFDLNFALVKFHENLAQLGHGANPSIDVFAAQVAAGLHQGGQTFFLFFEVLAKLGDSFEPKPHLWQ